MMQGQRRAPDTLGVALCGMGATGIIVSHGESTVALLILAGALYGMHRVLASRGALWAIAALVTIWVFEHFWELAPVKDSYKLMNEHPTVYAAPHVVRDLAWAALLVMIPVIGRARAGMGLMIVTVVAAASSALSGLALRAFDDKESTGAIVLGAIAKGWTATAFMLAAVCFVAIAIAPKVEPLSRRFGASVGVAGGALLAATLVGMPESVPGGHDAAVGLSMLSMAIAWIATAVGLGGFARAGGGPAAWTSMALVIAQVLLLPLGLALGETASSLRAPVASVLELGFFGIGLAALFAPSIGLSRARGLAGVLALVAVFGSFATLVRFTDRHLVRSGQPFTALTLYTYPVAPVAAVLWASCLAYLVAPPRDT